METLPEVTVTLADGTPLPLPNLIGAPAIIYFYPKADTPGCTTESQDFSVLADAFAKAGVPVIGVSRDPVKKLARFKAKHDLDLILASDEPGDVTEVAPTAGLQQTSSISAAKEWSGIRLVTPKAARSRR